MTRKKEIPLPPQDVIETLRSHYLLFKKIESEPRMAHQLKELKPLEEALLESQVALQNLSSATWDTIAWMAHSSGAGHRVMSLLGISVSEFPPEPDEIRRVEEVVARVRALVITVRGSFEDPGGAPGKPALRQLVRDAMPIWQDLTGKKPTFGHTGSDFEDFACRIVAEIDDRAIDSVHGVVRYVLTKKRRMS